MVTQIVYTNGTTPYTCTLNINHGMKYGFRQQNKLVLEEQVNDGVRPFAKS
jgi:hypothetical protein